MFTFNQTVFCGWLQQSACLAVCSGKALKHITVPFQGGGGHWPVAQASGLFDDDIFASGF